MPKVRPEWPTNHFASAGYHSNAHQAAYIYSVRWCWRFCLCTCANVNRAGELLCLLSRNKSLRPVLFYLCARRHRRNRKGSLNSTAKGIAGKEERDFGSVWRICRSRDAWPHCSAFIVLLQEECDFLEYIGRRYLMPAEQSRESDRGLSDRETDPRRRLFALFCWSFHSQRRRLDRLFLLRHWSRTRFLLSYFCIGWDQAAACGVCLW